MVHAQTEHQRRGLIGGVALIIIGLFAFAAQFVRLDNTGVVVLAGLAIIFAVWGILARNGGLLVPAGILGGVAVGIYLVQMPLLIADEQKGALMLFSLAGGFAAITILTYLVLQEFRVWSLIVAAVLALVGAAIWIGGTALQALALIGQAWPLALVIIGALILWQAYRRQTQ